MGDPVRHRPAFVAGAALIVAIGMSGCVTPPTVGPSPSVSASPSSAPSESPTPVALSCENIVTPAAYTDLTTGENEFSYDFETRMREENNDLVRFLDYGGVACQWGHPNSDTVVVLAYSPITEEQAVAERQYLTDKGWKQSKQADGSDTWATPDLESYLGNQPTYVFRPGNWRYALDASSLPYFTS
ncbi:MAG: hypothetical protein JWN09_517 [Microbacteriaceae bacterium]|nr:hypothetical protein [Microbacteriaceae bacterium]